MQPFEETLKIFLSSPDATPGDPISPEEIIKRTEGPIINILRSWGTKYGGNRSDQINLIERKRYVTFSLPAMMSIVSSRIMKMMKCF